MIIKEKNISNKTKVELNVGDSNMLPKPAKIYEVEIYKNGTIVHADGFGIKDEAMKHFDDMVEI